jgi:hypothetical protein
VRLHGADRPDRVVEVLLEVGKLLAGAVFIDRPGLGRLLVLLADLLELDSVLRRLAVGLLEMVLEPDLPAGQLAQGLANLVHLRLQRG